MRIVNIFAYRLFAFHDAGEVDNEYDRLLDLWTDTEYVREFLLANKQDIPKHESIEQYIRYIREDAIAIDEQLITITEEENEKLSYFFQPLHNSEYQVKILSLQKGRQNCLRLYAIKIDDDTFVITGGAIKLPLHHLMIERAHTLKELQKIKKAQDYLRANEIIDEDSFFEFLNNKSHD
ncbi:hypothetical protein [Paenimyroides aestuarii]|uniref:Uncharacterized protein n=1 Tax=Paenimyroides aestuarii TaxID=2968490 RepID=A0ABY5NS40_9FLAO|nr:hypothetical protein [Paenimyroides aestuarii]UUV21268.1 hypothetical protein NPX36_13210 [Paenimyroides aestuarii]